MRALLFSFCFLSFATWAAPWAPVKPKLVVVIVIDQFRSDYLSRFQADFGQDGFLGLIKTGAYFPYGEYDVLQSMTAPGHATVLTGAYPYQMGIPINEWFDQKLARVQASVEDPDTQMIGIAKPHAGFSPRRLIGTTVGDEMKNAGWPGRVVSFALKDRAAILLGGHRPDLTFWFDRDNHQWATSSYYRPELPAWMLSLNQKSKLLSCEFSEPCSADLTVEAFKAALTGEKLGQGVGSDLLALSFSGHDFAGHLYGPNSDKMKQMTLAEDRAIAALRAAVRATVKGGLKDVVWVLTGDHGVAPTAEFLENTGIEAENIDEKALAQTMNERLTKAFGAAKFGGAWIAHTLDFNFFVDERNYLAGKVARRDVENVIRDVLRADGRFAQVITQSDLENQVFPPGMFRAKVERTFYPGRSGLVIGVQKPYLGLKSKNVANHVTGYTYDRTVPILFAGFKIKSGVFGTRVGVVDIAPTLSFLLGLLPPALSEGRVLSEIF